MNCFPAAFLAAGPECSLRRVLGAHLRETVSDDAPSTGQRGLWRIHGTCRRSCRRRWPCVASRARVSLSHPRNFRWGALPVLDNVPSGVVVEASLMPRFFRTFE